MSYEYLSNYLRSTCDEDGLATVAVRRVSGWDVDVVRQAITEVIDAVGGALLLSQWRGERVLLKPNFCREGQRGETTSLCAIEAAIQILLANRCEIVLAEGMTQAYLPPRNPKGFKQVAARLTPMLRRYAIDFVHLNEPQSERLVVECDGATFHLPSCVREVAGLLNLATLKIHPQMVGSYAVKNHMGLISGPDRLQLHRTGIAEGIWRLQACLAKVVPQQLHLIDGLLSFQGYDAPTGCLEPKLAFGGLNPCAVDFACAQIMGIDPEIQFPQHSVAMQNNFAFGCGSQLRWDGPPLQDVRFQSHIPEPMTEAPKALPNVQIHWDRFTYPMNRALIQFVELTERDLPLDIYVGGAAPRGDARGRWAVLLGNASISACTLKSKRILHLPGDPPVADAYASVLQQLYGGKTVVQRTNSGAADNQTLDRRGRSGENQVES
jgi:uncharacterized protein (DUF362 family)